MNDTNNIENKNNDKPVFFVIDASVGIKWFSSENEEKVKIARSLQEKNISGEIEIIVPDLFFYEILNSFLYKRNSTIDSLIYINNSLDLMHMNIIFPDIDLMNETINIAFNLKITFYDALYIASAKNTNAILLTEDKKILSYSNKYEFIKSLDYIIEIKDIYR
jgi:predicted nucleic acid-binding protein